MIWRLESWEYWFTHLQLVNQSMAGSMPKWQEREGIAFIDH